MPAECDRLHCNDTIGRCLTCPLDLEQAADIFRDEYRRNFPVSGDAQDHDEATRCGVEAVLLAVAATSETGGPMIGETKPYRYEVSCWKDDCPGSLDTYGNTDEVLKYAQEHATEYGHSLKVQVKSIIEVTPEAAALADNEESQA